MRDILDILELLQRIYVVRSNAVKNKRLQMAVYVDIICIHTYMQTNIDSRAFTCGSRLVATCSRSPGLALRDVCNLFDVLRFRFFRCSIDVDAKYINSPTYIPTTPLSRSGS